MFLNHLLHRRYLKSASKLLFHLMFQGYETVNMSVCNKSGDLRSLILFFVPFTEHYVYEEEPN